MLPGVDGSKRASQNEPLRKVARVYFALKRQQTERQDAALAQQVARR
jgi:hypothetical protein